MKRRHLRGIAIVVVAAQALACSAARNAVKPEQTSSFVQTKPAALRPYFERLYVEGERNAVLNFNRLGLAALERGQFDAAARAFDESTKRINVVYADDENAKRTKSLWNAEKVKDFKGEPYERAMAFYYRGLVYVKQGDYENARASFLQAQFQDTQAENEEFTADFALMDLLAGWSSRCAGDDVRAEELIASALRKDPSLAPAASGSGRSLVLVESGVGPAKAAAGEHGELLVFEDRSEGVDTSVDLSCSDGTLATTRAGDVYHQASTRGGRAIQSILDGKAQFKDTTGDVAEGALGAAVVTSELSRQASAMGNYNMAMGGAYAGLGLLAISAISGIASAATTPDADVRYWETLPKEIYVASSDGSLTDVSVRSGSPAKQTKLQVLASGDRCSLAWGRIGTQSDLGPSDYDASEDGSKRGGENVAFRGNLDVIF